MIGSCTIGFISMFFPIFYLVISLGAYLYAPQSLDKGFMAVNILLAVCAFIYQYKNSKSKYFDVSAYPLRHSVLFITCFLVVFYQCNIDYVLGLTDETDYYIYDSRVVCKGLALSNIALSSLLLGYNLYKSREIKDKAYRTVPHYSYNKTVVVFLVTILLIVYLIFTPREYLRNGYGEGLSSGPVSAIMGYLVVFFISMFITYGYTSSIDNSWLKRFRIPLLLSILYIALVIVTGRRTESIRVGFIVLFFYIYYSKSINYKKILLWGFLVMIIFSISGVLRSMQNGDLISSYEIINNYSSVSPFTKELATSDMTLHMALSHYPRDYNYNWGTTFFPGFFKIVPGLSRVGSLIFGENFLQGSDAVFTNIFFGSSDISYGVGSSIVADVYISFGMIGVLVIFVLLGYFFRYLEIGTFCMKRSVYFLALSVSVYSQLMFACRGTIPIFFLCWAYSCILLFIVKYKNGKRIKRVSA